MVFRAQELNVMIGAGHYSERGVITIEPGIISFNLNNTCILIECVAGDKLSRKSGVTSFVSVLEAKWCVFVHILGANYVINIHPHLVFEIRVFRMKEWLKHTVTSVGVDLAKGFFW